MVEIRNVEDLERWLVGKSVEWVWAIRWRLGLKSLSLLGVNARLLFSTKDWRNGLLVQIIRPFISNIPKSIKLKKGRIHVNFYDNYRLKNIDRFINSRIRFDVIRNIQTRNSVYISSRLGEFYNEMKIRDFQRDSVEIVQSILWEARLSREFETLISSVSFDANALERGVDLWTQPLWLDDTPEWAVRGWETLATELTKRAPYWKTLVRWYEDRLHGDDWAADQSRPAIPELEIARASLPDSYWKKGGKAVNEAIAALEAFFWDGVPIIDPVLRELVEKAGGTGEPQVAALEDIGEDIDADDGLAAPASVPPPLPTQSSGPHFGLRDGLLDFAPPEHLDLAKNNIQRLRSLHPLLRAEADGAIDVFGRNMAHGRIHDALRSYAGLLDGDVTQLNYDLIAGIGVKLQSEEAAALGAIADGLEPSFERSEAAALKTLLDLHGPFILATEVGQTFVADAERWERNPRQERQLRQSATKLAEAIEADGIATPNTANFIKEAAADIGLGPQPERSAVFGVGAVRNVSIALIAGSAIYVGANTLMSMDMTHWLYVLLLNEGIKHSDVGKGTSGLITDAINDVTRGKALKRIYKFVVTHEAAIRKIAGKRREFSFLNEWLDWLKANPPTD